jgi:hypothetical protein
MTNTQIWLRGMLAAAVGGAGGALTKLAEGSTFTRAGMVMLGTHMVTGAALTLGAYLVQSPLPVASVTETTTKSETVAVTKN